jgi:hypothetical protein
MSGNGEIPRQQLLEKLCGCHARNGYCILREIILDQTLVAYNNGSFIPSDNKLAHIEIIEDIVDECPRKNCKLRDIALKDGVSDRNYEQIKCIEIYKWSEHIYDHEDRGWGKAGMLWVQRSFAEIFAEVYQPGMKHKELYLKIMEKYKERQENEEVEEVISA